MSTPVRPAFEGQDWLPADPGFAEAVFGPQFNRRLPDRLPQAVVAAASTADVIEAVRWARANGWRIAVRSGGHSWAGYSVRDDSILIDTYPMQDMELDRDALILRARPAIKGGETLNPFLEEHGLIFYGGHCPTVCLGGYLLQGGQGWNCRGVGWSAEYIAGIDVVTADGDLVHASTEVNPDLFWAARGAGAGFFGVVVNFYLRVVPRPRAWTRNVYVYPIELTPQIFRWAYDTFTGIDPRVEIVIVGQYLPPEQTGGVDVGPVAVVSGVAIVDDPAVAPTLLEPFDTCPVLDQAIAIERHIPTSLPRELEMQYQQNPEGHRYYVNNAWLQGDREGFCDAFAQAFSDLPNRKTFTLWYHQAPLPPISDMAFDLQSEIYFSAYTVWEDQADDERMIAWTSRAVQQMEPWTIGQYIGDSDFGRRPMKFMSDDHFARLQGIARTWDPDSAFVGYLSDAAGHTNANQWESA